jgi:prepilin-type processing-associated H-X9-DG protein
LNHESSGSFGESIYRMKAQQISNRMFELGNVRGTTRSGFTLVELLALIITVAFISVLVVPTMVRGRQKTIEATCQANLKEIGSAIQGYAEGNGNVLPGPVYALAIASYDLSSSNQLAWFLADRLGSPSPATQLNIAPRLLCPAHSSTEPGQSGWKAAPQYCLNEGKGLARPPFGRPGQTLLSPLSLTSLSATTQPSVCMAMADADKGNVNPTMDGWSALPYEPVHGPVRNQLFFDWHVAAKAW